MFYPNRIYLIALILFVSTNIFPQQLENAKSYTRLLIKERKEKDKEFSVADNSPLDKTLKSHFKGLNYYTISQDWLITARLERYNNPDTIRMKTTTERLPLYLIYGKAFFKLGGIDFNLTVFRNVSLMTKPGYEDYLFVPFRDETSGEESYGGGRYIDARIVDGENIVIDFNRSYNPYCVYSKKFSCPIPPTENYLNFPVTAGEKDFLHEFH
jgi:uncharacterized protein (DUF1684 family)